MVYSEEELKGLQRINLQMAEYFVSFCEEHDLLCYFCGGGCIGAVRHKGFIPWDDDLDFFMPRDDYEKLAELWNRDTACSQRYVLCKPSLNFIDHNEFITIRDKETTLIKPYQAGLDIVHGVALDIFPLDGYPASKIKRKMQCIWAMVYSLFCTQIIPEAHGKFMKWGSKAVLGVFHSKKIRYRIWKFAEKQMSKYDIDDCKYITELCAGPGYMRNCYPKEAFSSAVWLPFEGTEMPVPIGYDVYLRIAFGDYMKLPPEDKQIPHHDTAKLDLHKSYREYKGIYYCVR